MPRSSARASTSAASTPGRSMPAVEWGCYHELNRLPIGRKLEATISATVGVAAEAQERRKGWAGPDSLGRPRPIHRRSLTGGTLDHAFTAQALAGGAGTPRPPGVGYTFVPVESGF